MFNGWCMLPGRDTVTIFRWSHSAAMMADVMLSRATERVTSCPDEFPHRMQANVAGPSKNKRPTCGNVEIVPVLLN